MDGPTIQAAADTALRAGFRVRDVFTVVERISAAGGAAVVMTYFNPVLRYGVDAFARDLAAAGGLGVITPDLIPDEADEWLAASTAHGLDRIFLVAPSSTEERIASTAAASSGFLYATSTMGVTGARGTVDTAAATIVARCRAAHGPADRRRSRRPLGRAGRRGRLVRRRGDRRLGAGGRGGARAGAVRELAAELAAACAGGTAARVRRADGLASHTNRALHSCWAHTPARQVRRSHGGDDGARRATEARRRGMIGVWPPPPRALPACAPPRTRASWTRCAVGTGSGC